MYDIATGRQENSELVSLQIVNIDLGGSTTARQPTQQPPRTDDSNHSAPILIDWLLMLIQSAVNYSGAVTAGIRVRDDRSPSRARLDKYSSRHQQACRRPTPGGWVNGQTRDSPSAITCAERFYSAVHSWLVFTARVAGFVACKRSALLGYNNLQIYMSLDNKSKSAEIWTLKSDFKSKSGFGLAITHLSSGQLHKWC